MFSPIYLDYNATTPVDPRVMEAMLPYFSQRYGNASSRHEYGRAARTAVDEARGKVAAAIGAHASEVVFTSGGTEANNLFIRGVAGAVKAGVVAVSATEHPCVREPAAALVKQGWRFQEIGVDGEGELDAEAYTSVLEQRPSLISIMLANNETGVVQDIGRWAEAARPTRAWFHSDAVQVFGKRPLDFRALNARGVAAITLSAHKIGGPKGVGALVLDKRLDVVAQMAGGGHERGLRSGTENVPAIVGFGVACEVARQQLAASADRLQDLRVDLERGLTGQGATIFGLGAERLPNTVCFALPDIDGETLVAKLDRAGFAVASGAACASAKLEPSHVLMAMGVEPGLARGAVRVSLGRETMASEVGEFLSALAETVFQLRRLAVLAG